jgi:aspartyl-tRNA(Asn)/glutamyl-tRNA(Gln) amidotransferase subunit B
VVSETRGWREETQSTASQRSKEQAHDYRYFPEPDLPPLAISRERVAELRALLPELPDAKYERFRSQYGLTEHEAGILTESRAKADFFEDAVRNLGGDEKASGKTVANWVLGDLSRLLNDSGLDFGEAGLKLTSGGLAEMLKLLGSGEITGSAAKTVLETMFATGQSARAVVDEKGLGKIEDQSVVPAAVARAIEANPRAVADYKAGKSEAVKFLLGQVMRETRGRANAAEVQALLTQELDKLA